ncbi:MAG: FlgO family outer membrane protein [Desulforhopalus sp.]|jgi:TolB-like protein|nr:FlgO family outer membrane protein [Desulforhopalus sp.]
MNSSPDRFCSRQSVASLARLVVLTLLLAGSIGGCARLNCTPLARVLGSSTNLIQFSYGIAENLTDQALPPLVFGQPEMPILVTTFVDNNDLESTSGFGRILQEHVSSRLVQLGYSVREIKLAETLEINPRAGETVLSRDLNRLRGSQEAQAILVGTFSRSNQILYISSRLIDPVNANVIASDDYRLCMDEDILALFGLRRSTQEDRPVKDPGQPWLNRVL